MTKKRQRLFDIVLDEASLSHHSPEVAHERAIAMFDLLEDNTFGLEGHSGGPYQLRLGLQESRLKFEISDRRGEKLRDLILSLTPYRAIIRDYFTLCDSYYDAIKKLSPTQIEAIDMGRRAVHNEGASLLKERLAGKIALDENTARRLFTLICVLHVRDGRT